jgi:hypothetical protein
MKTILLTSFVWSMLALAVLALVAAAQAQPYQQRPSERQLSPVGRGKSVAGVIVSPLG